MDRKLHIILPGAVDVGLLSARATVNGLVTHYFDGSCYRCPIMDHCSSWVVRAPVVVPSVVVVNVAVDELLVTSSSSPLLSHLLLSASIDSSATACAVYVYPQQLLQRIADFHSLSLRDAIVNCCICYDTRRSICPTHVLN